MYIPIKPDFLPLSKYAVHYRASFGLHQSRKICLWQHITSHLIRQRHKILVAGFCQNFFWKFKCWSIAVVGWSCTLFPEKKFQSLVQSLIFNRSVFPLECLFQNPPNNRTRWTDYWCNSFCVLFEGISTCETRNKWLFGAHLHQDFRRLANRPWSLACICKVPASQTGRVSSRRSFDFEYRESNANARNRAYRGIFSSDAFAVRHARWRCRRLW